MASWPDDDEAIGRDEPPTATVTEPVPPPVWRCPGCSMTWTGREGSPGWSAYQAHLWRHPHARRRDEEA
jgi:hypothetical protein